MTERLLSIMLLACLLIVVGVVGLVYHARDFKNDTLWVEHILVLAIVAGIFMLRSLNWARWLAVVWIASYVVIKFLPLVVAARRTRSGLRRVYVVSVPSCSHPDISNEPRPVALTRVRAR